MNFITPEHIVIAMLSVSDIGGHKVVQRYVPSSILDSRVHDTGYRILCQLLAQVIDSLKMLRSAINSRM